MSRVILTGFRAFPGVPDNPTQRLIEHLREQPDLLPQPHALHLLDVDYRTVGDRIDALLEDAPRALVLTGYSNLARAITLESRAHGICAADKPDVTGHVPWSGQADPAEFYTSIDLESLRCSLEEMQLPAEISRDAGQYLCNFSYRHALSRVAECSMATQVLFVHVPALPDTPLAGNAAGTLPLEKIASAVSIIARKLAGPA